MSRLFSSCVVFLALFTSSSLDLRGQDQKIDLADTLGFRSPYRVSAARVSWDGNGAALKFADGKRFDPRTGEEVTTKEAEAERPERRPRPKLNEGEYGAQVSPDGSLIGLVRAHDLYIRPTEGGDELRLSEDGSSELLYGYLDWVYQEEVYGRGNFNGMWWSPDSGRLAFLKIDESAVKEFTVVDHRKNTLDIEHVNYPKAGEGNPVAQLGVFSLAGGETVWFDFSAVENEEPLIIHVGWNPAGDRVIFQVQNRIQNRLHLLSGDPTTGAVELLLSESSDTGWVNRLEQPTWLKDGSFLWWSERSGYKHLYHYSATGELLTALTSGEFVVQDIIQLNEETGDLFFYANGESGAGRYAYHTTMKGGEPTLLTPGRGVHSIQLNEAQDLLIDSWSNIETPPSTALRDLTGKMLKDLGQAEAEFDLPYSQPEYHLIPTRDGFEMDGIVIKPWNFDPEKSYPVMLFTYSGPDAPTVRDSYRPSLWHQFLAQEGLVILQVNNRTSSGRGQVHIDDCYKSFGVSELRDLEDAVSWLTKNSWADAERVGISGWSYGGFMAAFALTHSTKFALGVAGAGVYDWALYDTIYTERYMSTPQLNPAGYQATSVLAAAKNLHGHLVVVHGTMDDNVHLQNTIQLCDALQKGGKHFELMLYAGMRHGPRTAYQRKHIREIEWNAITKHLLKR